MKKYFLFSYPNMRVGGIQKHIYSNAKYLLKNAYQIIWMIEKKFYDVDEGFKDVINENLINIWNSKDVKKLFSSLKDEEAEVYTLSFDMFEFFNMLNFSKQIQNVSFKNYYIIPHYNGNALLIEENGTKRRGESTFLKVKNLYQKISNNGNLFFCNATQKKSFIEHYGFDFSNSSLLPVVNTQQTFCQNDLKDRFDSKKIVTCARFEFPHKGYILGLIDCFAQLKEKYPKLSLDIIGYGVGENDIKNKIDLLPEKVSSAIKLAGAVPYGELTNYYNQCFMFIGLAGALADAAKIGLISLVARHYCYDCEVYGSYLQHFDKVVCDLPGLPALPEMEKYLNYTFEEYCAKSEATYNKYKEVSAKRNGCFVDIPLENKLDILQDDFRFVKELELNFRKKIKRKNILTYLRHPLYTLKRMLKRYLKG